MSVLLAVSRDNLPVLTKCTGCGCLVVFEPGMSDVHATVCPGSKVVPAQQGDDQR